MISSSQKYTVSATSSINATPMALDPSPYGSTLQIYQFTSSAGCWIKQGGAGVVATGAAASGNLYVPPGGTVVLDARDGLYIAAIQDTVAGVATLTPVRSV